MGKIRSSEEPAVRNAKLLAKLYYHMAKAIYDELGEQTGVELIQKGLASFANDRVASMQEEAKERGIVVEQFTDYFKFRDMPSDGWVNKMDPPSTTYCPFADIWAGYGDIGNKLGKLYCDIDYILFRGVGYELDRDEVLTTGHSRCVMNVKKCSKP